MRTFRIFILGAGFSHAAGLPLGRELFSEVRLAISRQYGSDNHIERDLSRFVEFITATTGRAISSKDVDFEEFLGFLDTEHFLGLKGSDTWSSDGNESQLMIRHAIGRILLERTPKVLPEVYHRFAQRLNTTDMILTFNYDVLVERSLEETGIPYRLFPDRFTEVHFGYGTVDNSREEVVLLKLHGSVDWIDKSHYDERKAQAEAYPIPYEVKDPVFGPDRIVEAFPLVDGPRNPDDYLLKLYRVQNPQRLYDEPFWRFAPFILSPSRAKILYGRPVSSFWWGINRGGGLNLGLGIIGYSLPPHDDHARYAIFALARNYTEYEPDLEFDGFKKRPVRLLALCESEEEDIALRERFRFLNWNRTEVWNRGMTPGAVEWLLS